jgi:hypothetical protein
MSKDSITLYMNFLIVNLILNLVGTASAASFTISTF